MISRHPWMQRLLAAGTVTASMLLVVAPARATEPAPQARAWAVRIDVPGRSGAFLLADVSAVAGTDPHASGVPMEIAGQGAPDRADADLATPEDALSFHSYDDPTASLSADLGFAEAAVTSGSANAAAGFEASTGSGFSLANELFTFEQQEELLGQWTELQTAIVDPLNETLGTLGPLLEPAGLTLPTLEGITAVGLVDAMRSEQVASKATVASSPGFSSARASTTLRSVNLFGGFLQADGLRSHAIAESVAGDDTREAAATVGRLRIAGVEVVGDGDGLRVAGNDLASRTVVQPALDVLLGALEAAGITIRVFDARADGSSSDAAALEIAVTTSEGIGRISLAYAEASAPTVAAAGGGIPAGGAAAPPPPISSPVDTVVLPSGPSSVDPGVGTPGTSGQTIVRAPTDRRLGEEVARALQIAFVLFIVGALAGAGVIPAVGRRTRRSRSSILEEVSGS